MIFFRFNISRSASAKAFAACIMRVAGIFLESISLEKISGSESKSEYRSVPMRADLINGHILYVSTIYGHVWDTTRRYEYYPP